MDDLISRQAAIDALERIFNRCEEIEAHLPDGDPDKTGYKMFPDYMTVWKYLRQLPSAERRGRWIMHIDDLFPEESTMECDQCHEEQPLECDDKYCPNCGAKMEGEQNG